jgi:hypothetical protein
MKRILDLRRAKRNRQSHIEAFQAIKAENLEDSSSDPEATHGRADCFEYSAQPESRQDQREHGGTGGARGALKTYGQF